MQAVRGLKIAWPRRAGAAACQRRAAPRTVCTITVNSPDEKESFRRHLGNENYRFVVELVEARCRLARFLLPRRRRVRHPRDPALRPAATNSSPTASTRAVPAGERIDVSSCSWPTLFSPAGVYLFGCSTLNGRTGGATARWCAAWCARALPRNRPDARAEVADRGTRAETVATTYAPGDSTACRRSTTSSTAPDRQPRAGSLLPAGGRSRHRTRPRNNRCYRPSRRSACSPCPGLANRNWATPGRNASSPTSAAGGRQAGVRARAAATPRRRGAPVPRPHPAPARSLPACATTTGSPGAGGHRTRQARS